MLLLNLLFVVVAVVVVDVAVVVALSDVDVVGYAGFCKKISYDAESIL